MKLLNGKGEKEMKKIPLMLLGVIWILNGCSSDANTEATEEVVSNTEAQAAGETSKIYELKGMEYSIPEDWTEEAADENLKYYYPDEGMLMINYSELDATISNEEIRADFIEGVATSFDSFELISESEITVADTPAYQYNLNNVMEEKDFQTTLIVFDYGGGIISLFMATLSNSTEDYNDDFEKILDSINFTEKAMLEKSESTNETAQEEYYFDGTDLVTEDYKITITDHKVIQPGDIGNEYGDNPVIAFWYETTIMEGVEDSEYNPSLTWLMNFEAVQDNDPNLINTLNVGSLPDDAYLDSQLMTIKPGGTVANAVAYELTDLETPVTLTAVENLFTDEKLGSYDYPIK